jgi:hypothetical protein
MKERWPIKGGRWFNDVMDVKGEMSPGGRDRVSAETKLTR